MVWPPTVLSRWNAVGSNPPVTKAVHCASSRPAPGTPGIGALGIGHWESEPRKGRSRLALPTAVADTIAVRPYVRGMTTTFTKHNRGTDNLAGEAAGLRWLAQAEPDGGTHIAPVISVDRQELVIGRVQESSPTSRDAALMGASLAHMHAAGAPWWGAPPVGWPGPDWVGRSRTPLVTDQRQAPATWGEFYAQYRIDVFARRLRDAGTINSDQVRTFDAVSRRLRKGDFDVPQPALLQARGQSVARLHGDLWAGNAMYDGGATGATLIDPMAHGGHAETDLAALSVFGFPRLSEVYAGYDAESALAAGWQERIALHQLTMIIMHAVLFGGGYTASALELAGQYV